MQSDWARENLQVIRTLMERSAVYRRALAPVMLMAGVIGILAGFLGEFLKFNSRNGFVLHWMGTGLVASVAAFLLIRRQALKDKEAFWTSPTRRITQAVLPPFLAGGVLGLLTVANPAWDLVRPAALPALWMVLYGSALHSAGFFMAGGIRWLGWIFVLGGCVVIAGGFYASSEPALGQAHRVMGAAFGGGQLVYGIYLYFTEGKNVA